MESLKIREGFRGQKMLSLPSFIVQKIKSEILPSQIFITHIGFFPNAKYHYWQREKGCDDNIFFYCTKGKGHYIIGEQKYELNTNEFIIIPAGEQFVSYWADLEQPWTIYWVHFTGDNLASFNKSIDVDQYKVSTYIMPNEQGVNIWGEMYNSLSIGYDEKNILSANLALTYFLKTFLYPISNKEGFVTGNELNRAIDNVLNFMESNLDKKIALEELAEISCLSPSYFSKVFSIRTGLSPIEYTIHLKMQRACQLLYSTDYSIKK